MATIAGCEDCVASACRRFVRLRSGFVRPLFVVSPCGRRRVCGGARGAGAIIANQSLVGAAGAAGAASGCSLVQPHPLGSSALAFARASARAFAAQRLAARRGLVTPAGWAQGWQATGWQAGRVARYGCRCRVRCPVAAEARHERESYVGGCPGCVHPHPICIKRAAEHDRRAQVQL